MIVRELELKNFRSHGQTAIRFPPGKTLLEGDIGSGKSSVLMAIEFALFGLGSDSGGAVLKVGADEGEVRMSFEVDGSEYEVRRTLVRKGGRVQQSDGELRSPTETLNLSPSELKERILEILEFNEAPDPKAQSWIYRYAVYTPQEEMKSILMLAPEQRLQILRRAFRVEDYKTAATNAEEAGRSIRLDAVRHDALSEGMDDLRAQTERMREEEEGHKAELASLEEKEAASEGRVEAARAKVVEAQKKETAILSAKTEREHYERLREEADRDAEDMREEAAALERRVGELEVALKGGAGKRPPTSIPITELKRRERATDAKTKKLTAMKAATESKLSEYRSITEDGVCPVCERPVEAHDFDEKRALKEAEKAHVTEELERTETELEDLRQKIEVSLEFQESRKELAANRSEASRVKEDLARKRGALTKLEKRVAFAKENLQQLVEKIQELEEVEKERERAENDVEEAERELRKTREGLAKTRERIATVQKRQTEIAIQIVAKEDASVKGRRLREREIWLADYFVPTVRVIEKSVLATINQEFDVLFKKWFGMLVADPDKEVAVDEDFSPVVTQGGYDQDVRYLSGGERTSVALAYRLALNLLAQRVSVGMKSNLLILDEPTDGFSKEQLGSVREVLDEVGCPQVIIVSHDKELESFADQIFRVTKAGDQSSVASP